MFSRLINLLYFIPSIATSGGMERVLLEKVNFLANNGNFDVTIITTDMSLDEECFFDLSSKVKLIKLNLNYKNLFNLDLYSKYKKIKILNKIYQKNITEFVVKNKVDICISMGGKELEFLPSLNLPCKIIYESHFNKNFRSSFLKANNKNGLIWNIIGILRDWQHTLQARKFNKIVVLTDQNLKSWKKVYSNVIKIVNPSPLKKDHKEKLDLKSKRVLAVGKLDNQKGYDMLIEAWSIVNKRYPEWKLDIFGEGTLRQQLDNLIVKLDLINSVKLAGLTKDVRKEFLQSSFFVLSSRFEGLPMVLIESITCGLPIVAFDCETGPREIITSNDCGLLIQNGSIEALVEGISQMIENPNMLTEMSKMALIKAEEYQLDKIMEKWVLLFEHLLNKNDIEG